MFCIEMEEVIFEIFYIWNLCGIWLIEKKQTMIFGSIHFSLIIRDRK